MQRFAKTFKVHRIVHRIPICMHKSITTNRSLNNIKMPDLTTNIYKPTITTKPKSETKELSKCNIMDKILGSYNIYGLPQIAICTLPFFCSITQSLVTQDLSQLTDVDSTMISTSNQITGSTNISSSSNINPMQTNVNFVESNNGLISSQSTVNTEVNKTSTTKQEIEVVDLLKKQNRLLELMFLCGIGALVGTLLAEYPFYISAVIFTLFYIVYLLLYRL